MLGSGPCGTTGTWGSVTAAMLLARHLRCGSEDHHQGPGPQAPHCRRHSSMTQQWPSLGCGHSSRWPCSDKLGTQVRTPGAAAAPSPQWHQLVTCSGPMGQYSDSWGLESQQEGSSLGGCPNCRTFVCFEGCSAMDRSGVKGAQVAWVTPGRPAAPAAPH